MARTVQFRRQERDIGMVMREVDENLAIFMGLRNGEREKNELSNEFDNSKEPKLDGVLMSKAVKPETDHNAVDDDSCVGLEIDTNDYDWLLSQRREISLLPLEDVEVQDSTENRTEISNFEVISPKSELAKNSSAAPAKTRPVPSGDRKPTPRSATPTERRPMKSKPSRASTPTSRATSATLRKTTPISSKPQTRSSTPSRATIAPVRSKPVSRPATPTRKPISRSATPTRKPVNPSAKSSPSGSDRSSSGRKMAPTVLKNPAPSQKVKPRQSKPYETQKSCSPAKVRAHDGDPVKNGNTVASKSRGYSGDGGDDVNPVLMGTKMVERVVSMRKLAPPKQDDCVSVDNPKKALVENSGFGRSLSKKSLDMAMRHMDIGRSTMDLSSSACGGNQSSSCKSSKANVSESHLASSGDRSKSRNGIKSYFQRLSFQRL